MWKRYYIMDRSPCRGKKALRGGETRRAADLEAA
jgi:hypothetical protein